MFDVAESEEGAGNSTCRARATLTKVRKPSDLTGSPREARSEGPKVLFHQNQRPMECSADEGYFPGYEEGPSELFVR